MLRRAELRHEVYRSFALAGRAPTVAELAERFGDADSTAALRELHDEHALVLGDDGEICMALPFSAVPTEHVVRSTDRSWFANCAWDALAIPLVVEADADIESVWFDTGDTLALSVTAGRLSATDGFVHFALPARRWWDDIVET